MKHQNIADARLSTLPQSYTPIPPLFLSFSCYKVAEALQGSFPSLALKGSWQERAAALE